MSEQEVESSKVRFKANGDLVIRIDGKEQTIASYSRETGTLEFTTKENSVRYLAQVTARIGTVSNGTQPSDNVIRNIRIKGDAVAKPTTKRPKLGPEGDATEEFVQWMLENDLPQAIARYGIYTDEKGQIVRKHVRRLVKNTVDNRNLDDDDIQAVKEGPKTTTKAPVTIEGELIEDKKGIIARRATRLTFTPSEVVGGYQPDDDYESAPVGGEEAD